MDRLLFPLLYWTVCVAAGTVIALTITLALAGQWVIAAGLGWASVLVVFGLFYLAQVVIDDA
jgi:hypothetical protein